MRRLSVITVVCSLFATGHAEASDFWDEVRTPGLRAWRQHVQAAEAATAAERWTDAAEAANAAIALLPNRAPAYVWLGRSLAETSNLDDSVAAYRRALELDPESLDDHSQGSYAAQLTAAAGAHELSATVLRRLLGRMPDSRERADLYALYGDVLLTLGRDRLRQAILAFREASRQGGRANVRVSLGLSLALARSGETLESNDLARDAADRGGYHGVVNGLPVPEAERAARRAIALEATGDSPAAAIAWQSAAAFEPWSAFAQQRLQRLGQANSRRPRR